MNGLNSGGKDERGPRNVLSKAWKDIGSVEMRTLVRTAGATSADDETCVVMFMGHDYFVDRKTQSVRKMSGDRPAHRFVAALILHYLIGAKDVPLTERLLTFRELPGGDVYYDAFYRRAIQPLASDLGSRPNLLKERAKRVGGKAMNIGDGSVRVDVFPRVPVVAVVWMGDDEIPSSANILFDSSASFHLHTEDLAAVGDLVADALVLSDEEWRGW